MTIQQILYKKYVVEKKSINDISKFMNYSYNKTRKLLIENGIPMRSAVEGRRTKSSINKYRKSAINRGLGKESPSMEMIEKIRKKALKRSELKALGVRIKTSGYYEITKGENKGRNLHTVIMEMKLGRPLMSDECVHHIDEDKSNNSIDNLALVTKKGHARLHRFIDDKTGNNRSRNKKGQYI